VRLYWLEIDGRPAAAEIHWLVAARQFVESHASLRNMIQGYQHLLESIYDSKCDAPRPWGRENRRNSGGLPTGTPG